MVGDPTRLMPRFSQWRQLARKRIQVLSYYKPVHLGAVIPLLNVVVTIFFHSDDTSGNYSRAATKILITLKFLATSLFLASSGRDRELR